MTIVERLERCEDIIHKLKMAKQQTPPFLASQNVAGNVYLHGQLLIYIDDNEEALNCVCHFNDLWEHFHNRYINNLQQQFIVEFCGEDDVVKLNKYNITIHAAQGVDL